MGFDLGDAQRFSSALEAFLSADRKSDGIGTYHEKSLHTVLKYFVSSDVADHEIRCGKYICDVLLNDKVFEIQTRNLSLLKPKLTELLQSKRVEVIFPICVKKRIIRTDPYTAEVVSIRNSPKKEKVEDIFLQLCYLKDFLCNDKLSFTVFAYKGNEYRYAEKSIKVGRKRTDKYDIVPYEYVSTVRLYDKQSYMNFLSDIPSGEFTLKEYCILSGRKEDIARKILYVLTHCGILTVIKKRGKEYVYSRFIDQNEGEA